MTPARRVFVLLGAYEDITERESAALRRGDIDHAIALGNRKLPIAKSMVTARKNSELSRVEIDALTNRVRSLEVREKDNIAFLSEQMGRVKTALNGITQAAHRSRNVRRGYAGVVGTMTNPAEGNLGRA
jgi:hypothetical protein